MRKILFFIISLAVALQAAAKVSVEARIDSMAIFIGQQVNVTVSVVADAGANVTFPRFEPRQMITPGVEVLAMTDIPSEEMDGNMTCSRRVYRLTSFDEQLYYLPPFAVKVNGKEYKSKSLALKVVGIEIDSTNVDFYFGPKGVQDNPFQWSEWEPIFWLSFVLLLLIAAGYYFYLCLRDKKPIKISIKVVKKLLPHQKAMKSIEEIKAGEMVTSENQKEYYTRLTETLRKYIQERYGFNAMEMTSSEIIERLMASQDAKALDELRTLFQTADLVKFAKYSTLINENDMNLVNAIEFINSTKIENVPTEDVVKPQLSEGEKQTVKMRRGLKIVLTVITVAGLAIFVYVVYNIVLLLS